ncbi:copine-like protein [Achlya hypogyna]|uniref:Copine-like protein n=1 Tax=Achlya hypogyna TaxID=1202772 RepID=A0A1V9ZJ05_ACHHY|nr:copine-like protein [Achlya hypogyna]
MGADNSRPKHPNQTAKQTFKRIPDQYETYEQLQQALRASGLESSNLIVAIDYTKSNSWTGQHTFQGRCLHEIDLTGQRWNPYQSVIHIIGKTLEAFDDDKFIPAFGFGDSTTGGHGCFPYLPDGQVCQGFGQVLDRYNQITPQMSLAGPTNFAPVIREAMRIVQTHRSYHILVIIADGQVSNEKETIEAIVAASQYPISIIMVGVGDGPWDMMQKFDDQIPARRFDNFQFVEFNKMLRHNPRNPEVGFATAALMEIPADQFKTLRRMGML